VTGVLAGVGRGAAAGAAGTTALNAATYLDMALRGRPASSTPQESVERLADWTGVDVPGAGEERENRLAGLGPILGLAAGVGVGAVLGLARGAGWRPKPAAGVVAAALLALVAGNGPMAALGVSDPRSWSTTDWMADLVPHAAYGIVTAAVLAALEDRRS
jgi:hypothetical protein